MMSFARHQEMLRSVPANARKLFELIPIAEGWTYSQIHQESQRRGMNFRSEVIMGCVAALKDAGLVTTDSESRHQRVAHKPRPEPTEKIEVHPIPTKPPARGDATQPVDRLDKLATLAAKVRTMSDVALQLHHEAVKVAEALDDVALDLEENNEAAHKALQQLATLKALFKD